MRLQISYSGICITNVINVLNQSKITAYVDSVSQSSGGGTVIITVPSTTAALRISELHNLLSNIDGVTQVETLT